MASIPVAKLKEEFQGFLDEERGYILGTAGVVCTQAVIDDSCERFPDNAETTRKYGPQWLGRKVDDCSGAFSDAFKRNGGYCPHGSNSIWDNKTTIIGYVKDGNVPDGAAVYKEREDSSKSDGVDQYHVGLHMGDKSVIESKGTRYGFVRSKLSTWDSWGKLKGVAYEVKVIGIAKVKTSGGSLCMRRYPNQKDFAKIPNGKSVNVLDMSNPEWWIVQYSGMEGYVAAQYLNLTYQESGDSSMATANYPYEATVTTTNGGLNMRNKPSKSGSRIVVIPKGAPVTVLEAATAPWVKVDYQGGTGYCDATYLTPKQSTVPETNNEAIDEALQALHSAVDQLDKALTQR